MLVSSYSLLCLKDPGRIPISLNDGFIQRADGSNMVPQRYRERFSGPQIIAVTYWQ